MRLSRIDPLPIGLAKPAKLHRVVSMNDSNNSALPHHRQNDTISRLELLHPHAFISTFCGNFWDVFHCLFRLLASHNCVVLRPLRTELSFVDRNVLANRLRECVTRYSESAAENDPANSEEWSEGPRGH